MDRHKRAIAIFLILRNKAGEYLLQRRANTGYMDGHYDFGATGHLEADESIEQCAVREAKEEIGLVINPRDLKLVRVTQTNIFGSAYVGFYFLCETWQGSPSICEPEKCDDLDWFKPDNLPNKLSNGVRIMQLTDFRDEFEFFYSDSNEPL